MSQTLALGLAVVVTYQCPKNGQPTSAAVGRSQLDIDVFSCECCGSGVDSVEFEIRSCSACGEHHQLKWEHE